MKMLLPVISLLFLCVRLSAAANDDVVPYDRYTAKPATATQLARYKKANITSTCTVDIKPCNETEGRRTDGSCNNLKNPARGTFWEPVRRMLPASYANGSESRRAFDGSKLALPRVIRTTLLCTGLSTSTKFTQAMTAFLIWTFGDCASIHDLRKTLETDCCSAAGRKNKDCRPTWVPADDPTFRFANVDCLNMTKPILFSDFGCTKDKNPSPIQRGTALLDLSTVYNTLGTGDGSRRTFGKGQLTVEIDSDGIIWPPTGNGYCPANQPGETRCFDKYTTVLLQTTLISMWFMRQHNSFASQLAEINPCWDDEKLYQTARDINIAFSNHMYVYEYLPTIIGKYNMIKNEVIMANGTQHRDIYDETVLPQVSLEYTYAIRWFHTCQAGTLKMYAPDGTYLKDYPITNTTFRPGVLDVSGPDGVKNIVLFTQHMYRQASANIGHGIHPDLANRGQAYIQKYFDIPANDLHRGRYLGFAPYIDYVQTCTGKNISSFEDLKEHIDEDRIELLKTVYKHYTDIELLAGIWSEKPIKGGSIPATLACIILEFVKKAIRFDRHWYERPNRPNAFTKNQMKEIKKSTMAQFICNNGDQVSEIQPRAFRLPSSTNKLTSCSNIRTIDLTAWQDPKCSDFSYDSLSTSMAKKTGKSLGSSISDLGVTPVTDPEVDDESSDADDITDPSGESTATLFIDTVDAAIIDTPDETSDDTNEGSASSSATSG